MRDLRSLKIKIIAEPRVNTAQKTTPRRLQVTAKSATLVAQSKPAVRTGKETEEYGAQPGKRIRSVVPNTFRLGYLLHDVSRMRRTLFNQHMKPEDLTRSQWWVLANLSRRNGSGTTSSELAKQLEVGKVTVGGIVDRLQDTGYIYRRAGKADRRSKLIFITVKGYEVIARMRKITEELNGDLVKGLTDEDISTRERYLVLIKGNTVGLLGENDSNDNGLD